MIIYLGKLIACSGLLYLVYILLLQRQKLLLFNRCYLLIILPIALFIPFVQTALPSFIPDFFHVNTDPPEVILKRGEAVVAAAEVNQQESLMDLSQFISLIYLLVVVILLVRQILTYKKFADYINLGSLTTTPSVYTIQGLKTPFSFFGRIYVPQEPHFRGEIDDSIIAHEQAHVNQRHSIDVMIMQFMRVILWFNPMVYLIDKAIRQNHEYLADDAVVQVYERTSYQHLIIQWSMSSPDINALPASNFNFLTTKKRLIMLQKKKNSGKLLLMPALTLLLTAAISLLFSTHVEAQKTTPAKPAKAAPAEPAVAPPASKQPGAPKAVSERPNPPKREGAPTMKPKKSSAAQKEETIAVPAPKKRPTAKDIKEAPSKIEEVNVESIELREPKRVSPNGNAATSVKAINTNVQVNDPKSTATVKTTTTVAASSNLKEIRSTGTKVITGAPVGSSNTITSETMENEGKRTARIVLKGKPATLTTLESDKKNAPVLQEVRIQYRGEIPKNPPLPK